MSRSLRLLDKKRTPKKRSPSYLREGNYNHYRHEIGAINRGRPSKILCLDCLSVFQPLRTSVRRYDFEKHSCKCGSLRLVKLPSSLKIPKKNKKKKWVELLSNVEEIIPNKLYFYRNR